MGNGQNKSDILLVFQAPGENEWKKGKPIQPTKKQGGAAGARIEKSWEQKQKNRTDFDIINSVQCFPGRTKGNRDSEPAVMAICCCSKRLLDILKSKQYTKIIIFGKVAFQVVSNLASFLSYQPKIINAPHPNGGVKNDTLDALW